ncbi:MAG: type I 3-dehydroquinate dehydratase [Spirochaetia bacterium]
MICLALTGATLGENLALLQSQVDLVDLAELRIDLLSAGERTDIGGFPERVAHTIGRPSGSPLPLICTARRAADGGSYVGPERERLRLLEDGINAGFGYVDLELDLRESPAGRAVAECARAAGCEVIRSIHDPVGQPADPAAIVRRLSDGGREIAKLAVTPRSTADLVCLLEAGDRVHDVRKILIGMGPYGIPTRILSRRFGSLLTYVSAPDAVQAAPGHIGPAELLTLYRFRDITADTRFFGIIGSPVAHSRSPEYHNRRFAADRLNARYLPILVDDVGAFFELADRLPLHGVSVTIPHKRAVLPFLADVDAGTTAAGSCNTLVRPGAAAPTGWQGANTDVPGFLAPLRQAFGTIPPGMGATVIGAGGAARAVVYALLQEGARVLVVNRSADRAACLVSDLQPFVVGSGAAASPASLKAGSLTPDVDLTGYRDVIVQTTSVGMHGAGDPAPWLEFDGSELVYDIVYTPSDTPIIVRARSAGCRTVTGDRMFDAQADSQYRLFSPLAVS